MTEITPAMGEKRPLGRRKMPRKSAGLLSPVLWILSAVLAVQLCQSFASTAPFSQVDKVAWAKGVLLAGGVGSADIRAPGWMDLFTLSSQNLRNALAKLEDVPVLPEEFPEANPRDWPELSLPPASAGPEPLPSAEPAADTPAPLPPESASPTAEPLSAEPELDPATAWIGGPYVPPSANDPAAKKLLEVTLLASTSGYDSSGLVAIKNKVTTAQDVAGLLKRELKTKQTDGSEPQILIVFTHGSESFFPDERNYYVPTDIQRTEDTQFNVVRVGNRLAENLRAYGLNVLVDETICDMPSFTGAYAKSLKVIEAQLKANPSIQMVIDVHRDSLQSENGTAYKVVSDTERGKAAQLMLVMGTDLNGLVHPGWRDNLAMACQVQQLVAETYPTLMRPVNLRKERFNQHATPGSMLLEVGTAWNTLPEALLAVDLFCEEVGPFWAEEYLTAR